MAAEEHTSVDQAKAEEAWPQAAAWLRVVAWLQAVAWRRGVEVDNNLVSRTVRTRHEEVAYTQPEGGMASNAPRQVTQAVAAWVAALVKEVCRASELACLAVAEAPRNIVGTWAVGLAGHANLLPLGSSGQNDGSDIHRVGGSIDMGRGRAGQVLGRSMVGMGTRNVHIRMVGMCWAGGAKTRTLVLMARKSMHRRMKMVRRRAIRAHSANCLLLEDAMTYPTPGTHCLTLHDARGPAYPVPSEWTTHSLW